MSAIQTEKTFCSKLKNRTINNKVQVHSFKLQKSIGIFIHPENSQNKFRQIGSKILQIVGFPLNSIFYIGNLSLPCGMLNMKNKREFLNAHELSSSI